MTSPNPDERAGKRPKRGWLLIVLCILMLGAGVLGYKILKTPGWRPELIEAYGPPILKVDEVTHDLGQVDTDGKVEHVFHISNGGGQTLEIYGIEPSCGCTIAEIEKTHLEPGETLPLKTTLDTSIKLGHVKKEIVIKSNDPKHPMFSIFLVGEVMFKMVGHEKIEVKDPLVLFKGECATCHVDKGKGKTGKNLFVADCAMCHGQNAQGNVAMGLVHLNYDDPKVMAHVRDVIANGSKLTPEMPPFSAQKGGPLTEGEIDSLVNTLKFMADETKAAAKADEAKAAKRKAAKK